MPVLMTAADVQRRELRKLDEGGEPSSDEALEAECLNGIEQCQVKLDDIVRELAALKMRYVGRMSAQSRAALQVMGHDLTKSRHVVEEAHMEWQRRLGAIRKTRTHAALQKNHGEAESDLALLESHMAAINARSVVVAPEVRRHLARAFIKAQLIVAASA